MSKLSNSKIPLKVLGIGNPILDILAEVPDSLIKKYKLELNNMYLAEPRHMPLYKEVQTDFTHYYIPGGATLNSMRFCQAFETTGNSVMYSGCIGNDNEGESMKKLLKDEGLTSYFQIDNSSPTGICAVLINSNDRAMCTNLGASGKFTYDYFKKFVMPLIPEVDIIFSASYFMSASSETMLHCANHCAENNKIYALSLGAIFIIETMFETLSKLLPYTNLLFGNEEEFLVLAKLMNLKYNNLQDLVEQIANLPKVNKEMNTIIILTRGTEPVIVANSWPLGGTKISLYPILKVPDSKIIDVNGCGDAFVGGFLYGLSYKKSLDECVYYGLCASSQVIQHKGAFVSKQEILKFPAFKESCL